jgi:hypothetical protein
MDLTSPVSRSNVPPRCSASALGDIARQARCQARLRDRRLPNKRVLLPSRRTNFRYVTESRQTFQSADFADTLTAALVDRPGPPVFNILTDRMDRPRQFEYSPTVEDQLVYGTVSGNLVVVNQGTRRVVGACRNGGGAAHRKPGQLVSSMLPSSVAETPSIFNWVSTGAGDMTGALDDGVVTSGRGPSVLGLSWLRQKPNLFLAGTEEGAIHLYNVDWMSSGHRGGCVHACDTFDQLTSIHVSSDDRQFVVSGFSRHVGLYDLESGTEVEHMSNVHDDLINVLKFANHNPNIFVTSSFDRSVRKWDLRVARPGGARRPVAEMWSKKGNVMVCFSPDDKHLLVSAVDNEVRQFTSDGKLEQEFNIRPTGSDVNYTRSYYMNGGDYVITGSCQEDVVRVYNSRTGRCFREIELDGEHTGFSFVQSLRANPNRDFNLSVLLAVNDLPVVGRNPSVNSRPVLEVLANFDLTRRLPHARS